MFGQRKIGCDVIALLFIGLIAGCAPQVLSVDTRPGVTVSVLVSAPDTDPKGIFLLFPGGVGLAWTRAGEVRNFFPVVPHLFTEQGFVAAVVNVPSDQPRGFESGSSFRGSKEHAEDARKIIDFLSQKWPKQIFLLGHSRGGESVTSIALALKDERINGIILTGTGRGTSDRLKILLEETMYPVLRVHHRDDNCSSFEDALKQTSQFFKGPRVNFIEVLGGHPSGELRCGPNNPTPTYTHYFSGKEREVVKVVTDWVLGKPVPDRIGP